jgi:hypothetical protein
MINKEHEISNLIMSNKELDKQAKELDNRLKNLEDIYKSKISNLEELNKILQDNYTDLQIDKEKEIRDKILQKEELENK